MRAIQFSAPAFLICLLAVRCSQAQQNNFKAWDENGDGVLSKDELPEQLRGNFENVDANGNGQITAEEDRAFRQRNRANATPQPVDIPDNVEVRKDIAYVENGHERQKLHLLLPKVRTSDVSLPLLVYVHGGGWQNGTRDRGLTDLIPFVASGNYIGATIGYRLTDTAQWPGQIHDCKAAIRWLRGHAEELGFDPQRVGVFGHSAGGHLVAMLGVAGDVDSLEGDLGEYDDLSSAVTCVVDYFGPTDFLRMNDQKGQLDHDAPGSPESKLLGGPVQEHPEKAKAASPVEYVSQGDAPFLIFHGTADPLVPFDQSVRLQTRLGEAKVPVLLVPVTDGGHGNFNKAPDVIHRMTAFFDKHLRKIEAEISEEPIAFPAPRR